jgi:hypothetical protein
MDFDHIGIVTTQKQKDEIWVDATKVWVTDYKKHPYKIEWLRYREDSPVKGKVREMPHIAYRVENLDTAADGMKVLIPPFDVGFAIVGFYESADGAVIEFMKYK